MLLKFSYLRNQVPDGLITKLRDFKIEAWSENGINNLNLLLAADQSTEIKRNTYTEVEHTLRNQGYEEKAEEVYKQMWKKVKTQMVNGKLKPRRYRWLCGFRSWFGYGRKQARISFIIFLFFSLISIFIFTNPNNVIPATLPLAGTHIKADRTPSGMPTSKYEWGFGGGLWFTLRYNVPIVPFNAREQWRPNIERLYYFGTKSTDKVSAQDYAEFVELSHWIIWSIFLIYFSGIIRRGENIAKNEKKAATSMSGYDLTKKHK